MPAKAAFESPLELDLRIHYKRLDEASGPWDGVRINRLCALLRVSASELARLIRVPPGYLLTRMTTQKFPAPVRLLLDLVETCAQRKYLGRKSKYNVLPEI